MEKNVWHGIEPNRFKRYRHWKTPKGYLCGTYAASVLIAYYQDYFDETMIPTFIRRKDTTDFQRLASVLQIFIQYHGLPTISWQVAHGLSRFFRFYNYPISGRATYVGGWQRAIKRIDEGKPVIVGVNRFLGSTYGNHWVVAYAYLEDDEGNRFFKVHDNWGNYETKIPVTWVNGTVSLP